MSTSASSKLLIEHLSEEILSAYCNKVDLDALLKAEIESHEYIFENPIELAIHLRKLLEVVDVHLKWEYHYEKNKLTKKFDAPSFHRLKQRINEASRVVAAITPLLKFIDGSKVQKNNWGIVTYVDRFCRRINPKARVIIRPRWEYNYTFISITEELNKIASQAQFSDSSLQFALKEEIESSSFFLSLAYPPISAQNMLQLVIWSHEIAHFIDALEGSSNLENSSSKSQINEINDSLSTVLVRKYLEENESQIDKKDFSELSRLLGIFENDPNYIENFTNQITEPLSVMITYWAREIFADLLSIRLMGPAALFPFLDFVYPVSQGLDAIHDLSYPPLRLRLRIMLKLFDTWGFNKSNWMRNISTKIKTAFLDEISYMRSLVETPRQDYYFLSTIPSDSQEVYKVFYRILEKITDSFAMKLLPEIDRIANTYPDLFITPSDLSSFLKPAILSLEQKMPPVCEGKNDGKFLALVLNAGWLYWLDKRKNQKTKNLEKYEVGMEELKSINLLIIKAIENLEAKRWFDERASYAKKKIYRQEKPDISNINESSIVVLQTPGALSGREIRTNIEKGRIKIEPLLDKDIQIGSCSFDVRLGNEFIVARPSLLSKIDPAEFDLNLNQMHTQTKIYIPFGKPFVLHPGQFVLGSTLEYFKIPDDIMGLLIGRSSWGRLGLSIATPNKINPGFSGSLTLQIGNLGNIPIQLYPCARLGQIIFIKSKGANK